MGKYKERFIVVQNLIRCVEFELNKLELERDENLNFLNCLSREILKLNKNLLEPFSEIRVN